MGKKSTVTPTTAAVDALRPAGQEVMQSSIVVGDPDPSDHPHPVAALPVIHASQYEKRLVQGDGPAIYLVEGSKKRWIVNEKAFVTAGFKWENVKKIPNTDLTSIPDGQNIGIDAAAQSPGTAVPAKSDNQRYAELGLGAATSLGAIVAGVYGGPAASQGVSQLGELGQMGINAGFNRGA